MKIEGAVVLVIGADEVWIDCGDGLELTGVRFPDDGTGKGGWKVIAAHVSMIEETPVL